MFLQTLYNAALENNCSEQASRMAAMESSTKNATEMLGKLTLSYNRSTFPQWLHPHHSMLHGGDLCALTGFCCASFANLLTAVNNGKRVLQCLMLLQLAWDVKHHVKHAKCVALC